VHYAQLVIDDVLLAHGLLLVKNKPLNDSPLHKITGGGLLGSGALFGVMSGRTNVMICGQSLVTKISYQHLLLGQGQGADDGKTTRKFQSRENGSAGFGSSGNIHEWHAADPSETMNM
jgi:hypothetical protein